MLRRNALWLIVVAGPAFGQQFFPTTPDWVSSTSPYSTGAALVDLNRDGWLDLVVSNGNDMSREHLTVYYNDGTGHFPTAPSWQSADVGYNGHLDVADVNGDGWPDVAVARLLNEGGPAAKLYINHNGTLSSLPEWTCTEIAPAFTVAFGDVNNDGRPDLAIGTGDSYSGNPHAYKNTVHLNINGQLEQTASWQSADTWCYESVLWADVDQDGWLDLIGIGGTTYTWVYHNLGGTLETSPSWHTTDNVNQFALMAAVGDVTGDGRRDLLIADNNQLTGGSGKFKQYTGQPAGFFAQTANWSYSDGYCSAIALADVNADGRLDLVTGAWWDRTRIFLNTGSGFGATPTWSSGGTSTVEKIVFGDIDQNALRTVGKSFPASPGQCLFYLDYQPIQQLVAVRVNGSALAPSQYTHSREFGWVTVGPYPGDVQIDYTVSTSLDLAITNWDVGVGNYVYYNRLVLKGDANCDGAVNGQDIDPFVLMLFDPAAYLAQFPGCNGLATCDMNNDGAVNGQDIDGFVAALFAR